MNYLPKNCTIEDVENADTETIYYSYHNEKINYSFEVIMEMAFQLALRGV